MENPLIWRSTVLKDARSDISKHSSQYTALGLFFNIDSFRVTPDNRFEGITTLYDRAKDENAVE